MAAKQTKKERKLERHAQLNLRASINPVLLASTPTAPMRPEPIIPIKVDARNKVTVDHQKIALVSFWTDRCQELLQQKGDLTDDEKEYLAKVLGTMRDEKLKNIIAGLLGWGDEERAEMQTFCAIALEMMQMVSSATIRDAAQRVEMNYYLNQQTYHEPGEEYYAEDSFALAGDTVSLELQGGTDEVHLG